MRDGTYGSLLLAQFHLYRCMVWTLSTLEALRNALYKFKTYLLTSDIIYTTDMPIIQTIYS